MNTPNKLTMLRIFMIPVFMVCLMVIPKPLNYIIALAVFALASITDLIDGKLARKNNQITNFGKLMDPLADKLLVTSALICFIPMGLANVWAVFIIIAREFLVTSIRLVAAGSGKVVPANIWGKIKTNSQMFAVIFVLIFGFFNLDPIFGQLFVWLATVFTVISGVTYWVQNKEFLSSKN